MGLLDELTSFFEGEPRQEVFLEGNPIIQRRQSLFETVSFGVAHLDEVFNLSQEMVQKESEVQNHSAPAEIADRVAAEPAPAPNLKQFSAEEERADAVAQAEAAVRAAHESINPLFDYDRPEAA